MPFDARGSRSDAPPRRYLIRVTQLPSWMLALDPAPPAPAVRPPASLSRAAYCAFYAGFLLQSARCSIDPLGIAAASFRCMLRTLLIGAMLLSIPLLFALALTFVLGIVLGAVHLLIAIAEGIITFLFLSILIGALVAAIAFLARAWARARGNA